MPNVIVNGNTYNGIQTVKLPLAEDTSRFAYFNYDHSDEEGGGGGVTPQITIEEGSYTVNNTTVSVSGATVSVTNPGTGNYFYDISRIQTGNSGQSSSNVTNKAKLFTIPAGATIRLVATYSKVINPTTPTYVNSVQLYLTSGNTPLFIPAEVDRTDPYVFIGEKTVSAETDVGAICLFTQGDNTDFTVDVKIYVNNERWL